MKSTRLTGAILGYDPGGSQGMKNGVACMRVESGRPVELSVGRCASVDEVIQWFRGEVGALSILGMGVDTVLAWSGAPGGSREADRALRARFPACARSVVSPNSLRGSMCLSGPLVAVRLRSMAPHAVCMETHPKLLFRELGGTSYNWRRKRRRMRLLVRDLLGLAELPPIRSDDEYDAALSIVAARGALSGEWTFDLYSLSGEVGEQLHLTVPEASYPWPVEVQSPARSSSQAGRQRPRRKLVRR